MIFQVFVACLYYSSIGAFLTWFAAGQKLPWFSIISRLNRASLQC